MVPQALEDLAAVAEDASAQAGLDTECNQHHDRNTNDQHRNRHRIIIEPVSALYAHNATSISRPQSHRDKLTARCFSRISIAFRDPSSHETKPCGWLDLAVAILSSATPDCRRSFWLRLPAGLPNNNLPQNAKAVSGREDACDR
jgi:hypothetical protein